MRATRAASTAACGLREWGSRQQALATVGEVRYLPAQVAGRPPGVLRGTITYSDNSLQQVFFQDATGGLRVQNLGLEPSVKPGDWVELQGAAIAGGPSPAVRRESIRIVAPGTPLGSVPRAGAQEMFSGRLQYPD